MPRVALIQDGTEVARQRFADVRETFDACRRLLSDDGYVPFTFEEFTDEEVDFLLESVDPREWSCLVFASNALRSEEVANAVEHRHKDLHEYLRSSGGIVVLHQITDSFSPLLPDHLLPEVEPRSSSPGIGPPEADDVDDVLLHFPTPVEWSRLRDLTREELRTLRVQTPTSELSRQFFMALRRDSLPGQLRPVLTSPAGEVLLARTEDHVTERVVVATMPLDWQGHRPGQSEATVALLSNAIRYAALGTPRRLVWRDEGNTSNELLRRWLCLDGGTAMCRAPAPEQPAGDVDCWLLGTVDVLIVPPHQLASVAERHEVGRFLDQGGTLLTTEAERKGNRITAIVGRYEQRELSTSLFTELRAVDGWRTHESAFRIRNIVAGLSLLTGSAATSDSRAVIEPAALRELVQPIQDRLLDPNHQEDYGSSLALTQTLAFLVAPDPVDRRFTSWLAEEGAHREYDIALQASATSAHADREPPRTFLADAADARQREAPALHSLAPVVRILDAVALLHQADLLGADPGSATRLGELACQVLHTFPAHPERGWISVEATADIVRGLIAIDAHRPPEHIELAARLAAHVASGATALRRARPRYERNAKGVAWLARLTHALVVADHRFPLGLQRMASLDWPDVPGASSMVRSNRALLESMSVENERLRRSEHDLAETLRATGEEAAAASAASALQLAQQRRAGQLGRATATLLPTIVLLVASWWVAKEIGFKTTSGLLANITVLMSIVLALLGGAFGLLERWHLLASPAARFRKWLEKSASPVVASVAKLKRG